MGFVDGSVTSAALCWTVERSDGAGLAVTSHDSPVALGDRVYEPNPGMLPASVSRRLGLEPTTSEVSGALSSDGFSAVDLALGRWDHAHVTLLAADWASPASPVELLSGELGEVAAEGETFAAELLGTAVRLAEPVCPATSPECRAEFGDKRCRVDLAGRTLRATVVSADGGTIVLDEAVDERFVFGRLRYLSGANCGRATVVLRASGNSLVLRDLPRAAVEPGCRIELREGCDKRFATCRDRFANAANFRGEPHLPGNDLLTRYPGG